MNEKKLQIALLTVALGLWMLAAAFTFLHACQALFFSDLASGVVLILLGVASMAPKRIWSGWAIALVGVWLQFAPLVFWAPAALTYLNDTFVGALLIALSFLLTKRQDGLVSKGVINPAGWSYNPSSWNHRIPTVGLAMLCWFFSRYMAAYQLGYIDQVWDPIFTNGTLNVITSKISHDFPVSDAGLGALCYTLESVLGWQGSDRRWCTMPWLVLAFGFLVIPVGAVSITLIILQPVAVGSWCSWCLATAASMLLMIILTAGELIAGLQFLRQAVKAGRPFWNVFFKGGVPFSGATVVKPRRRAPGRRGWGITIPWNLVLTVLLGAWLMTAPNLLQTKGYLATVGYIEGPLLIALSIIAMAEVFRSVRFINILLGVILIATPWIWPGNPSVVNWNNMIIGLLVFLFSFRKGKISERYGAWDKFIY